MLDGRCSKERQAGVDAEQEPDVEALRRYAGERLVGILHQPVEGTGRRGR